MKLLLASRNRHKLAEFRAILGPGVLSTDDIPGLPEIEETAETFEGNAILKARGLALASGLWTLADDSGLEVDFLDGAPGVRSARYAGENATDADNLQKLLDAMRGVKNRSARFRCALALSSPDGQTRTVSGACEGRLAETPRGANGFGYDPLFIPDGHTSTFAELPAETKNALSHRARAIHAAKKAWGI
ncbi:MAG: RdgB/HAM1 family non-canonical purine NTP pyrophosphatase [Kiritimatiellaeota bacterium]|nr:RdgB/HAM1 family non-canonical purine NTP pyrophosphatase [Kiritimatiellota bacterium]